MNILEQILEEIGEMPYPSEGIGCGLEDVGITDRYEAAAYGWNEAVEGIGEIIRSNMEDEPVSNTDRLDDGWIPAEYPPETNDYILLSFSNFSLPLVGRYDVDETGGAFYLGDCDGDDTCISNDLYVNAWRPLPGPYRPKED